MAEDVQEFLQQQKLSKCVLIGHSMYAHPSILLRADQLTSPRGAKTAMTVALRSPGQVAGLIPVDNAPVHAPLKTDFSLYVEGMQRVDAAGVTKQSDADQILQEYEEVLLRHIEYYYCQFYG